MNEVVQKLIDNLKDSVENPVLDFSTCDGSDREEIDNFAYFTPKESKVLLDYIKQLELDVDSFRTKYKRANELYLDTSKKVNQLETNRDEVIKELEILRNRLLYEEDFCMEEVHIDKAKEILER